MPSFLSKSWENFSWMKCHDEILVQAPILSCVLHFAWACAQFPAFQTALFSFCCCIHVGQPDFSFSFFPFGLKLVQPEDLDPDRPSYSLPFLSILFYFSSRWPGTGSFFPSCTGWAVFLCFLFLLGRAQMGLSLFFLKQWPPLFFACCFCLGQTSSTHIGRPDLFHLE